MLESFNIRYKQVIRREEEHKELLAEGEKRESDERVNIQVEAITPDLSEEKGKNDANTSVAAMQPKRSRQQPSLPNKKNRKKEKETPAFSHDDRDLSRYYDIYYEAQRNLNAGNIQTSIALYKKLIQQKVYLGLVISALEKILKSYPDNGTARAVLTEAQIALKPVKKP